MPEPTRIARRWRVDDPRHLFAALAELHDARVTSLEWRESGLFLRVDDVFSGFLGLPEYKGPLKGQLSFEPATDLVVEIQPIAGPLAVYGIGVTQSAAGWTVDLAMAPGGRLKVVCDAVFVDFDPFEAIKSVQ